MEWVIFKVVLTLSGITVGGSMITLAEGVDEEVIWGDDPTVRHRVRDLPNFSMGGGH
jgi:hypothetical protein